MSRVIEMRDGSKAKDPRLGLLIPKEHDERNRKYGSMMVMDDGRKLRSWSWNTPEVHVLDQGREGACAGFGASHTMMARLDPIDLDNAFAQALYYDAQRIDPFDGGEYPGADPVSGGTTLQAVLKVLKQRGQIDAYHWDFGLEQLAYHVSWHSAAYAGTVWMEGMMHPDDAGMIHATGDVVGGHAYCIDGVSLKGHKPMFRIKNSWGPFWGHDGHASITFDDMASLLKQQGEAAMLIGKKAPVRSAANHTEGDDADGADGHE